MVTCGFEGLFSFIFVYTVMSPVKEQTIAPPHSKESYYKEITNGIIVRVKHL